MKIIQTLYDKDWLLKRDNLNSLFLSIILAKNSYGNIHLYTDTKTKSFIDLLDLPYDSIDTSLDSYDGINKAVPRILTYSKQSEPFLHIHNDSFLFNKISVRKSAEVIVSHSNIHSFYNTEICNNDVLSTQNVFEFFKKYIQVFYENRMIINERLQDYVEFDYIPNLSIFGGNDYKSIVKASKFLLKIYNDHSETWDTMKLSSYALEELLMIPALRTLGKKYNEQNNDKIKFDINIIKQLQKTESLYICETHDKEQKMKLNNELICYKYTNESYKNVTELMNEYVTSIDYINISKYKHQPIIRRLIKRILSDRSVDAENEFLRNFAKSNPSILDVDDIFYESVKKYTFGLI